MVPACPECGAPLRGVDDVRLQEHIDHKYPIICGDCGNSSPALEWREGKAPEVPKTVTPKTGPLEKVLEVDEDEEGPVKKVMMPAKEESRYAANPHPDRPRK